MERGVTSPNKDWFADCAPHYRHNLFLSKNCSVVNSVYNKYVLDEVNQELERLLTNLEAEETNVHIIMKNMDILTNALRDREMSTSVILNFFLHILFKLLNYSDILVSCHIYKGVMPPILLLY
jgi:hypothetical protein